MGFRVFLRVFVLSLFAWKNRVILLVLNECDLKLASLLPPPMETLSDPVEGT